jgi:membrane-bound lytic murein transglycosylase B
MRPGIRFLLLSLIAAVLAHGNAAMADSDARQLRSEIESFIEEMADKHQFAPTELRRLFAQVGPRKAILNAVSAPSTALPWHQFRKRILTETRISYGVRFWLTHAATLARAREVYGVPEELIVATIGVETLYGRQAGRYGVLEALTTLAFDYPKRAEFFRSELEHFLLLARETGMNPLAPKGSYAGAMGIAQFMPSSYRRYAVDFDGDGKIDLWNNPVDAIGSVANYYRTFGWRLGDAVVVAADTRNADVGGVLEAGIKPGITVGELRRRGVQPLDPVNDGALAALFVVQTADGSQAYVGLHNFYVITRYNRSINYALVVNELARELRALVAHDSELLTDSEPVT